MTIHPKTGRPIQPHATFKVGDAVTISVAGDSYPAVVVHATPKTVYVHKVGVFIRTDPHPVGTGEEATEVILDPDGVDHAMNRGKDGAEKYVLYVSPRPVHGSYRDRVEYTDDEGTFHRSYWRQPGADYLRLTPGANVRRDPHV